MSKTISPSTPLAETPIRAEAGRIQVQDFLNRKGRLQDLFAYLVSESENGRAPNEAMIAADVFGKTIFSGPDDDATVRVYIHRLRGRLEEHYRAHPIIKGEALSLPKGEYRLTLIPQGHSEALSMPQHKTKHWAYLASAFLALNIAAWGLFKFSQPAADTYETHPIWTAFETSTAPTVIVVGDYYIYQPAPFDDAPQQLIRDFAINSAQDLTQAQNRNPDAYEGSQNIDLHYLPVSTAYAIAKLSPLLKQSMSKAGSPGGLKVMQASDVTAATLKDYNIVYLGFLSGLNYLSRPAFENSYFINGATYDQIVDLETGITYDSSEIQSVAEQTDYLDYGYVAQFDGPGGKLITLIAGTRDTGLQGVSDILSAPLGSQAHQAQWAQASHFEALYEVRGEDRENLRQTLISHYSK